jgi:hypothetical protein
MLLSDVLNNAVDQNKGRDLNLVNPFTGEPTGMVLRIAGPDSETARRSRLALADELAELADEMGRVSAENREAARLNALARLVLGWEVEEAPGKPMPFNTRNVRAALGVLWVQEQVDVFAATRRNFGEDAV